jgi:glycosyltransferase involved in cell wall biosynthesis
MPHGGDIDATVRFRSVVHVNEKGGSFGGTEEYVALLTAALADRGVSSHLVCGAITGELPRDLRSVDVIEDLASRELGPTTAAAVADAVAVIDADVVYVHNIFDAAVLDTLAAIPGRGHLLWYVHDHYLTCLTELRLRRDIGSCPHPLGTGCLQAIEAGHCVARWPDRVLDAAELVHRLALAAAMARADAVVVVSDYMERLVGAAAPDATVHRLTRPIRPSISPSPRRGDDPTVVLFAGRINAEKGLGVLLEALAGLPPDRCVELRIAGVVEDSAYWAHCCDLAAAAQERNAGLAVTTLGHLPAAAIDSELARADIVAIPSQWPEPLGAIALEAMAAGAAVVASRVGGLADTVVDGVNGVLVRADDRAGWCDAVAALVADPRRRQLLGSRGRAAAAASSVGAHVAALDRVVASLVRC